MTDDMKSTANSAEPTGADVSAEAPVEEGSATAGESSTPQAVEPPASPAGSHASEQGEIKEDAQTQQSQEELLRTHRWCKCVCDPAQFSGQDHYFLHMDTQQSQWEEPSEPYWLWDATTQAVDPSGLQQPMAGLSTAAPEDPDPEYYGYNPKIHGNYDPNAPYAQYHNRKREQENYVDHGGDAAALAAMNADYTAAGTFNRFTGAFQSGEQSADRHSDFNKSARQMGAFFDVDAAANSHDGRSLKEERRNEKLSKKQIKELAEKRRAKKEKKRMDFYKS